MVATLQFPPLRARCEALDLPRLSRIEDRAVRSDVPTLVLSGPFDPVTPPRYGREVASRLSRSFFFEFSFIGHGGLRSRNGEAIPRCAMRMTAAFVEKLRGRAGFELQCHDAARLLSRSPLLSEAHRRREQHAPRLGPLVVERRAAAVPAGVNSAALPRTLPSRLDPVMRSIAAMSLVLALGACGERAQPAASAAAGSGPESPRLRALERRLAGGDRGALGRSGRRSAARARR